MKCIDCVCAANVSRSIARGFAIDSNQPLERLVALWKRNGSQWLTKLDVEYEDLGAEHDEECIVCVWKEAMQIRWQL